MFVKTFLHRGIFGQRQRKITSAKMKRIENINSRAAETTAAEPRFYQLIVFSFFISEVVQFVKTNVLF